MLLNLLCKVMTEYDDGSLMPVGDDGFGGTQLGRSCRWTKSGLISFGDVG